jgi:hypothetical protein
MREENCGIRPVENVRGVRTSKTVLRKTIEREVIARELLERVTNYTNLRPPVLRHFNALRLSARILPCRNAYAASGDPVEWKRERDREANPYTSQVVKELRLTARTSVWLYPSALGRSIGLGINK